MIGCVWTISTSGMHGVVAQPTTLSGGVWYLGYALDHAFGIED